MIEISHNVGLEQGLENKNIQPGNVYFTTDTHRIYFDTLTGERIQMGETETNSISPSQIESLFKTGE